MNVSHLDVTTPFLHGVFMRQPEGFIETGKEDKVLKLNKAICVWYKKVEDVLRRLRDNSVTVIALYVDDFFIFYSDILEKVNLTLELRKHFKLKDLGQAKQILGMTICFDKEKQTVTLNQSQYIDLLLSKFGYSNGEEFKLH